MKHAVKGGTVLVALMLLTVALGWAQDGELRVDATKKQESINRGLFSFVNYQYLYANGGGKATEQFMDLRPAGSQARIETRFSDVEPKNDNNDPNSLNRDAFHVEEGVVFVNSASRYTEHVAEVGMERMILLAYDAPWLAKDGRLTGAPKDMDEWLEFAVNMVRHLGGDRGAIQYVEVWNEPNIRQFWTGTKQEYFDLFNATAEALHEEFPGIQVGGPALSPQSNMRAWISDFIDACGSHADFLSYHSYGHSVEKVINDIRYFAEMFREKTGKQGPRIIITESDHRVAPAEKFNYLMNRQFALLRNQDDVLGFHHFSLNYYKEGNLIFGLIDTDASVLPYNYWPYWTMRDLRGKLVDHELSRSLRNNDVDAVAAVADEGKSTTAVLHNDGSRSRRVDVAVTLPPAEGDVSERVATVFTASSAGARPAWHEVIPASERELRTTVTVPAGSAAVVSVKDADVQDAVWTEIEVDQTEMVVGTEFNATMTIRNIGNQPLRGRTMMVGQPTDWETSSSESATFSGLEPGETFEYPVKVQTNTPTPRQGSAVYTFVTYRAPRTRSTRAGSIPVRVQALAPLSFQPLPLQVYVAPGGQAFIDVTATNTFNEPVSGDYFLRLPGNWRGGDGSDYSLDVAEESSLQQSFTVPAGAETGDYTVDVAFTYRGMEFTEPVEVYVRDFEDKETTMADVSDLRDSDLFTAQDDFYDVSNFGGPFSYPAEFYPSNETVSYLGVEFAFPPTHTGSDNGVRVASQDVSVPTGSYSALYFLSAATNGDKTVEFTLEYDDGSTDSTEVSITDWCRPVEYGEIPVARAPYRHHGPGVLRDCEPRIMMQSIPVDSGKTLTSVELPEETDFWIIALSLVE